MQYDSYNDPFGLASLSDFANSMHDLLHPDDPTYALQHLPEAFKAAADVCTYVSAFGTKFSGEAEKKINKLIKEFNEEVFNKVSVPVVFKAASAFFMGLKELLRSSPQLFSDAHKEAEKTLESAANRMSQIGDEFDRDMQQSYHR